MELSLANVISQPIVQFHFTKGNRYIPTALNIFNVKVIPQQLFGISLWIGDLNSVLEHPQGKFLVIPIFPRNV